MKSTWHGSCMVGYSSPRFKIQIWDGTNGISTVCVYGVMTGIEKLPQKWSLARTLSPMTSRVSIRAVCGMEEKAIGIAGVVFSATGQSDGSVILARS
ncbi:hypothetical protein ACH5RR_000959 [Cinchona calisaya]|uniref:Uncharacterized protein n=1 Tax=Cinchona calisaya TaxID=153742 RepID=A0ABD3B272_9GENT